MSITDKEFKNELYYIKEEILPVVLKNSEFLKHYELFKIYRQILVEYYNMYLFFHNHISPRSYLFYTKEKNMFSPFTYIPPPVIPNITFLFLETINIGLYQDPDSVIDLDIPV